MFSSMSQQLAFWYKALRLQIPRSAAMEGGVYLWKDGREVPDTMNFTLQQPEEIQVSWVSGFGNNQLGVGEDVLGTHGSIARQPGALRSKESTVAQRPKSPDARRMFRTRTCKISSIPSAPARPNCPFDLGYRVSIACAWRWPATAWAVRCDGTRRAKRSFNISPRPWTLVSPKSSVSFATRFANLLKEIRHPRHGVGRIAEVAVDVFRKLGKLKCWVPYFPRS